MTPNVTSRTIAGTTIFQFTPNRWGSGVTPEPDVVCATGTAGMLPDEMVATAGDDPLPGCATEAGPLMGCIAGATDVVPDAAGATGIAVDEDEPSRWPESRSRFNRRSS